MFAKDKNKQIVLRADNLSELPMLIEANKSFRIDMLELEDTYTECSHIEEIIKSNGLTCRIYTKGRLLTLASGLFNARLGLALAIAYVAHNVLTHDPDYEIARDLANKRIYVEYQR